jgi:ATP-binding cassette subfamily B (MDR/TAP) protein 1
VWQSVIRDSTQDWALLVLAAMCAFGMGGVWPTWAVLFGRIIDAYEPSREENTLEEIKVWPGRHKLLSNFQRIAIYLLALAVFAAIVAPLQVNIFLRIAQRLSCRIRTEYFRALLRQEVGWFDGRTSGEMSARMSGSMGKIQAAMGEKVSAPGVCVDCECCGSRL